MPIPITAELVTAIAAIVVAAGTAWGILRKLRPEIAKLKAESERTRAEADQLKSESEKARAEAEKARSERDAAEANTMKTIVDTVNNIVGPLNNEIKILREGREEDRKRIRDLETSAAKMGTENVELRCKVESLETQNTILHEEVQSLRRIVDDYRSGRRKPTGPLGETP